MLRPPNQPGRNKSKKFEAVYPLLDPQSPSGFTHTLVWGGNNADLKPETARSWMIGAKWSPPSSPGAYIDIHYYNINSFNQILPTIQLLPVDLFSNPQYNYLINRNVTKTYLDNVCSRAVFMGPTGACESSDIGAVVDLRLRSAETVKTDGIDLQALFRRATMIGDLSAFLEATYILHFKATTAPGTDFANFRNTAHNPMAIRLRGVFRWEGRHFSISPAVNLDGSYTDTDSVPSRPVGAWMTWDMVLGYKADTVGEAIGGRSTISLRALNVFNRQPPFVNNNLTLSGYDPENGDLLGRRILLRLDHEW